MIDQYKEQYNRYPYSEQDVFAKLTEIDTQVNDKLDTYSDLLDKLQNASNNSERITYIDQAKTFMPADVKFKIDDLHKGGLGNLRNIINVCNSFLYEELGKLSTKRKDAKQEILKSNGFKTHEVDGVLIPLNPSWKRVAVNLSGGADSAMMTSILAKIILDNNYNIKIDLITHNRGWLNRPWQLPIAEKVYSKLKDIWGDVIGTQYTNFIPPELEHGAIGYITENKKSGDQIIVETFNNYMAQNKDYKVVYNSTTKNPTMDNPTEDRMRERDVDAGKVDIKKIAICKDYYWNIKPLLYTEKDWVIKQYHNMSLLDLLSITRSCEGDASLGDGPLKGKNAYWYKPHKEVPTCGHCFWCVEREWAMEKVQNEL